jgi:hypothetical protein
VPIIIELFLIDFYCHAKFPKKWVVWGSSPRKCLYFWSSRTAFLQDGTNHGSWVQAQTTAACCRVLFLRWYDTFDVLWKTGFRLFHVCLGYVCAGAQMSGCGGGGGVTPPIFKHSGLVVIINSFPWNQIQSPFYARSKGRDGRLWLYHRFVWNITVIIVRQNISK